MMHLNVNTGNPGTYNLIWSNYEGIKFSSYDIYRGTDQYNLKKIGSSPNNLTSYTDNTGNDSAYYYLVSINLPFNCDPNVKLKASSGPFSQSISNIEDNRLRNDNINHSKDIKSVNIFPNPTDGDINISYILNSLEDAEISIISVTGIVVYNKSIPATAKNVVSI